MDFIKWPKIPRADRALGCIITEKVDGTNAQIARSEDGDTWYFGSRSRWLSLEKDNFNFCWWGHQPGVVNGLENIVNPGRRIYGEWFGAGIQRRYGLEGKFFMPFNHTFEDAITHNPAVKGLNIVPVPVLYKGRFEWGRVIEAMDFLDTDGSQVAPGFMKPEGVVVYFPQINCSFKRTFEELSNPKFRKEAS
jgi:hypothetical protein